MCRLFGMTSGRERVKAEFWLLDASDSLESQSRRNPDGTGLGTFREDGTPRVEKQPLAAFEDAAFAREAASRESSTFLAHVRYSTGTAHTVENTHPFEMDGRLCAHNGAVGETDRLERELGDAMSLVKGQTDSERIFALVTREIRAGAGVGEAMTRAVRWLAENVPVFAVNLILTTPDELWALRYPETHELWVLERTAAQGSGTVAPGTSEGSRVRSEELSSKPSVVVASERLDNDPGWRLIDTGTLLHVDPQLAVTKTVAVSGEPRRRLELTEPGSGDTPQ
ncbi:class II glutamine amidotransferase [Arthrobacter sp. UM1]|uniref:class II glutamine amidotransferase n=1 Tax=Arthrobacter sp. UM1 TaxID=2766776 RepID=UPI001CF68ED2|nr:class II glutamine amidotransferase [Arthrobacter sp. UM1]MCB4208365.1 class II glutamine amidotransferase [Arthrobacter sp. UM1]